MVPCAESELTYEPGELAEPPGDVDGQHGAVALLQRQVGQVVGEAAELLRDAGVAQVQHDVEAQRLEGGEVALPGLVVELDAGGVLLVLRQAQHLQVVVAHKVLGLGLGAAQRKVLDRKMDTMMFCQAAHSVYVLVEHLFFLNKILGGSQSEEADPVETEGFIASNGL